MTTATPLPTACAVLSLVESCGPAVDGQTLDFATDLPEELELVLSVLHTGVRAVLAGKRWYGCDGDTGRIVVLNPAAQIPGEITLLCAEGDDRWDRIPADAGIDCPRVFVGPRRPAR